MASAEYQQLVEFLGRLFTQLDRRFGEVNGRFDEVDGRFVEVTPELGSPRSGSCFHRRQPPMPLMA